MTITAACDGSALGNPGPAGWAWYVDDDRWAAGGWPNSTNNRGELQAVLSLLQATAHLDEHFHLLCDSQYVINALTKWMPGWKKKGWKKRDGKDVLNRDLMEALDLALADREVTFEWVKGHSDHRMNEAADSRARAAAEAFRKKTTVPEGPGWHDGPDDRLLTDRSPSGDTSSSAGATAASTAAEAPSTSPPTVPSASAPTANPDSVTVSCDLPTSFADDIVRKAIEEGVHPQTLLVELITRGHAQKYTKAGARPAPTTDPSADPADRQGA
ncbi:ribonuclease H family protein [Brevibacterium litoralis]|uniref:ribonuclease H family protein n=1 Tax=Brevibacterium litoralis TaxID=3138935 RepID=UPI0032ECA0C6